MLRLFYNCNIYSQQNYDAIVIDRRRIAAVGASEELRKQYANAELIDLNGAYVYPAFADSHAHIYGTGERVTKPRLEPAMSLDEAHAIVRRAAESSSQQWIVLRGWDHNKWGMTSFPTKQMLEGITTKPLVLTRVDGHASWLNQAALDAAGIRRDTQAPHGGEILKDEQGQPNGILLDEAMKLVESKIPQQSQAELKAVMRAGVTEFVRNGNATVHDMGIPAHFWPAFVELYEEEGDKLPRAHVFLDMNQETGKQYFLDLTENRQPTTDNLKLIGIKIYLDGALGSRGAELFEDYSDDPGNRGLALSNDDEVIALMKKAADLGMQIAVHAIGDKANHRALSLFERSGAAGRTTCRIEHAQIVRPEDLEYYRRLGVQAVIQPPFFPSDRHWAVARLGEDRMKDAYRWRSLIEAGIPTVASSDSPVEPPDTIFGITTLVSRDGVEDGEALTEEQAIALYTSEAAKLDAQQGERGTIEPSRLADLTILDRPVLEPGARVIRTILEGRTIHSADH
jgi:predicted amidohydrolase YtcJ